jgi:hypothetical protein
MHCIWDPLLEVKKLARGSGPEIVYCARDLGLADWVVLVLHDHGQSVKYYTTTPRSGTCGFHIAEVVGAE